MPQINIREIDNTGLDSSDYAGYYAVLIPGKAASGKAQAGTIIEVDNVSAFTDAVGENVEDGGYTVALKLLKLGMTVVYAVVEDYSSLEAYTFWEPFEDRAKYDIRFIACGAITGVTLKSIHQHMITCAATRGDAIALIDAPKTITTATDVKAYMDSLSVEDVKTENPFKYAAGFGSFWKAKGETDYLPGSVHYLADFATHTKNNPDWFAMSGVVRGVAPYEDVETEVDFGDADVEVLEPREIAKSGVQAYAQQVTSKACNVIVTRRPYGKVMWGNRTLFPLGVKSDGDSSARQYTLTASSFLNIRHICCDIKKTLYRACTRFSFEPNSDTLWVNFVGAIKPLLEEMKSGQGIRGYDIVREATKQTATLKARIRIIPIEAVEDFDLTVELSDSISVTE